MNEEEVMLFDGDEQRGGLPTTVLIDEDYTEQNKTYNRVKNYSFARSMF